MFQRHAMFLMFESYLARKMPVRSEASSMSLHNVAGAPQTFFDNLKAKALEFTTHIVL